MSDVKADVVVVGAGISGLSAAYLLWKKDSNISIIVLEAKDRLGGRTLTVKLPTANDPDDFDLGGQWVGSCQPHIMSLLDELGMETYRQFTEGKKCMQLGSKNEIRYYNEGLPGLPVHSLLDLYFFSRKVESLVAQVPVDNPMECPLAEEWDSMTAETFLRKHLWTQGACDAVNSALTCIFGALPKDFSLLYFLHYCRAAGSLKAVIESGTNSGQEFKIKGGAQQISQQLAERIGHERVWLGHPVTKLTQSEGSVTVETTTGKKIECQQVIMAAPPHMAGRIQYEPTLPASKSEIFQRMPVGYLIKVIVTYRKAFWRVNNLSGELVTNGGKSSDSSCSSGPLCIVFDATTHNHNPALVGFIGATQGVEWSQLPNEERRLAVLNNLAECIDPAALDYIHYIEKNWQDELYNGGCPVSSVVPGAMSSFAVGLREPFQKVHFACTESATVWCGFMNGAVQAGWRAANEVLYHIRPELLTAEEVSAINSSSKAKKVGNADRNSGLLFRLTFGIGALVSVSILMKRMFSNHQT